MLPETLCYLRHLERSGRVAATSDGGVERWIGIVRLADQTLTRSCQGWYCAATMRIDQILARRRDEPVFSFEFFPPKTDEGERVLREAL